MPQKVIAGVTVEVNDEGYLTDHSQWTRAIADTIAKEEGISALSENHWKVIDFIRNDFKATGTMPTIRRLKSAGGIDTKLLYELYPGGPLKKAAKIAGLPKPASCV